jgi:hypothetical protein
MSRFIKLIPEYIFQTYLYMIFSGYKSDLKKDWLYVDIRHVLMPMRARTTNK